MKSHACIERHEFSFWSESRAQARLPVSRPDAAPIVYDLFLVWSRGSGIVPGEPESLQTRCANDRRQRSIRRPRGTPSKRAAAATARNASVKVSRPTAQGTPAEAGYDASTIEVLEGLEPVRRRPGMYRGHGREGPPPPLRGGDRQRHGRGCGRPRDVYRVELEAGNWLSVTDNGRGIPVDPHPKFPRSPLSRSS